MDLGGESELKSKKIRVGGSVEVISTLKKSLSITVSRD